MALDNKWTPIGRAANIAWEACATELGLDFTRGTLRYPPRISGDLDGFAITITCTDDRVDKPKPVTLYQIDYRSLGGPIRIARETAMTRVGVLRRLIEVPDIEVGHAALDRLALIDAESVEVASEFLTIRRRQAITELLGMRNLLEVAVSDTSTTFRTKKIETSARKLAGNTLGLVEFARILGQANPIEGTSLNSLPPSENFLPAVTLTSYFETDSATDSNIQDSIE